MPDVKELPSFFVGKEIAKKRIQYFMDSKYPLLTENNSKTETRSIWYSFEHIKALYEELDYLNASGLRIYFGAYLEPDIEDENEVVLIDAETHSGVAGQLSLLMVPTEAYIAGNNEPRHTDLIVEDKPDFTDRLIGLTLEEFILANKTHNAGSPCPPACITSDIKFP